MVRGGLTAEFVRQLESSPQSNSPCNGSDDPVADESTGRNGPQVPPLLNCRSIDCDAERGCSACDRCRLHCDATVAIEHQLACVAGADDHRANNWGVGTCEPQVAGLSDSDTT